MEPEIISDSELRRAILRHLVRWRGNWFGHELVNGVLGRVRDAALATGEMERVEEAVHELRALNYVLTDSLGFPHIRITALGREVAEHEGPPVHDPDGYLAELLDVVPELPPEAQQYVREAIQAFVANLLRSATVMIGTASEILIQRLIEAWGDAVGGNEGAKLRKSAEADSVAAAFIKFRASFEQHKSRIDARRFKQDTLTMIEQVFHFIRLCRNDAGHAIGFEPPDRPLVQAHLVQFRYYARRLYDLIAYLNDPGLAAP